MLAVQRTWPRKETKLLNILELRTVRLFLQQCNPIRVQSGNVITVAYMNHQKVPGCIERSKADSLMDRNSLSSDFCSPHYRSGQLKVKLYQLPLPGSRAMISSSRCVQSDMPEKGIQDMDILASRLNNKLPLFCCQNQRSSSSDLRYHHYPLVSVHSNSCFPSSVNLAFLAT